MVVLCYTKVTRDREFLNDSWFADGTFKTAPLLFAQLCTIHAIHHDCVVPLVYALLPDKSQQTYERLLSVLKDKVSQLNPRSVMIDFEIAAKQAFEVVFPRQLRADAYFI